MTTEQIIDDVVADVPTAFACRVLAVAPSSYYARKRRGVCERARRDIVLTAQILTFHLASGRRYGRPRICRDLRDAGESVSGKRVARLMRQSGVFSTSAPRFRATTDSTHQHPIALNIVQRDFSAVAPDRIWVGDITYVWTLEGWLYLAVLIDLFSRRVVGWATAKTLSRDLPMRALTNAIALRKPPPGLVHHTDRGSQHASADYRAELRRHRIIASMSKAGDCFDNAVAESFFATIKKELICRSVYLTRRDAETDIAAYIDNFYNVVRRHSSIDMQSPVFYERQAA